MKLLLYDACVYTQNDMMDVLYRMHIPFRNIVYKLKDVEHDEFFSYHFTKKLREDTYDAVFSVNYYPIIAQICYKENIKYISWSYDSPLNIPNIEKTLGYATNFFFLFDRIEYEKYKNRGFDTVYHLPLGINVKRLESMEISDLDKKKYTVDISFVGEIYDSLFSHLLAPLPEYDKGYIEALVAAQLKIYGYFFIDEMITDEWMERINKAYRALGQETALKKHGLSAAIAKQVTHIERITLLGILSEVYKVRHYGRKTDPLLSKVDFAVTINYYTQMPKVFRLSKINLNPTLKCIQSGIPLRALDILASRGFLLSNYQIELGEYFIDGEDLVFYHSMEDALIKTEFYMKNEELRHKIAKNGYEKVIRYFSYEERINTLLELSGLKGY